MAGLPQEALAGAVPIAIRMALAGLWNQMTPEQQMYVHMVTGSGQQAGLPPTLRATARTDLALMTGERATQNQREFGGDPGQNPNMVDGRYATGDQSKAFNAFAPEGNWGQTLGRFSASPVGTDSVAIRDHYDFHWPSGGSPVSAAMRIAKAAISGDNTPVYDLENIANHIGKPYDVRDRVYAPEANANLRRRGAK